MSRMICAVGALVVLCVASVDEGVKDFLAKVPRAEFVELSDAGHTAAGDDNDAFSEAVVQFVSR